jgi:hypothetical protein
MPREEGTKPREKCEKYGYFSEKYKYFYGIFSRLRRLRAWVQNAEGGQATKPGEV